MTAASNILFYKEIFIFMCLKWMLIIFEHNSVLSVDFFHEKCRQRFYLCQFGYWYPVKKFLDWTFLVCFQESVRWLLKHKIFISTFYFFIQIDIKNANVFKAFWSCTNTSSVIKELHKQNGKYCSVKSQTFYASQSNCTLNVIYHVALIIVFISLMGVKSC